MFKDPNSTSPHWERQVLQKVLLEHIQEQRRSRRWNLFFKLLYIGFVLYLFFNVLSGELPQPVMTSQAHTALIDLSGEIGAGHEANAEDIRNALKIAFENKHVKGVVLRINSPGGSPVQSHQIYSEIRALQIKYPEIKLYAAIEDLGASGGYLIASAADAIYADKSSLVGSIGAKIDSFGFVEAMHKLGVERRLYKAGKNKNILDPFSPRDPEADAFITQQLQVVHQAFIDDVKAGRGTRLQNSPDLFSGLFWSGPEALKLGLIDGFGDAQYIAKELVKSENLVDYSPRPNLFDKMSRRIGTSLGVALSSQLGLVQKGVR